MTLAPTLAGDNRPPVADAGPDLWALPGTRVSLDGSGSRDPDGPADALAYRWTQVGGPTAVNLAGSDTARPNFVLPGPGTYVFSLRVGDGGLESATDTVIVTDGRLQLLSPNGGETFRRGQKVAVRWQSYKLAPGVRLRLQWSRDGIRWKTVQTARNRGGATWKVTRAQAGTAVSLRLCGPNSLPSGQRCDRTDAVLTVQP
jgi:hypothetical protein